MTISDASLKFIHCMIHVRDLQVSIEFYERALGFKISDRHKYDGHMLVYMQSAEGDMEIELISPDAGVGNEVADGRLWHMAFSTTDLKAEYSRLLLLDYKLDPPDAYYADSEFMCNFFYVYDPDGHQIEILESYGRYER